MEFNKCSRCGSFYVSQGNVCPRCSAKDAFEFSTFKGFVEENGLNDSLDSISGQTGISVKNLNRFLNYEDFNAKGLELNNNKKGKLGNTGIILN